MAKRRQVFNAVFSDQDHIFNADTELPRQVNPRLNRHDDVRRERCVVPGRKARPFPAAAPDGMAEAVGENEPYPACSIIVLAALSTAEQAIPAWTAAMPAVWAARTSS